MTNVFRGDFLLHMAQGSSEYDPAVEFTTTRHQYHCVMRKFEQTWLVVVWNFELTRYIVKLSNIQTDNYVDKKWGHFLFIQIGRFGFSASSLHLPPCD